MKRDSSSSSSARAAARAVATLVDDDDDDGEGESSFFLFLLLSLPPTDISVLSSFGLSSLLNPLNDAFVSPPPLVTPRRLELLLPMSFDTFRRSANNDGPTGASSSSSLSF
jgi:hypothetical protein